MRSSTMAIFLFAIAALALLAGMEWLAIVLGILAFGMLFFYRQMPALPAQYPVANESAAYPGMQQPPQIVIVDQGGGHDLASQIEEHVMLEKALGGAHEREEEKHKKKLNKELKHLQHEIKHLKHALHRKGKKGQDDGHH